MKNLKTIQDEVLDEFDREWLNKFYIPVRGKYDWIFPNPETIAKIK
jgi:hypothetical protein